MKLYIYSGADKQICSVGQVFAQSRRGRLTSTFAYNNDYIAQTDAYAIDPTLPLANGAWPSAGPLPRAIRDSAPDRWGRNLIDRRAAIQARQSGVSPRQLSEVDYLLGVSDTARQGALRFKTAPDGPFEHPLNDVPKLVELPLLLDASQAVAAEGAGSDEAVNKLLDLGSASLGGARPKASVRDGGRLLIAKFPHPHDAWNVMAWEKTALDMAELAGIDTPARQLIDVDGDQVLLVNRFDRTDDGQRVGYISGMTVCQADDGQRRDYLEYAEQLATVSSSASDDLSQLWRRMAFGLAINNTDDHLRNHAMLRQATGWRLSPVFDLNPEPNLGVSHATSIAGATGGVDMASAMFEASEWFGLTHAQAVKISAEVQDAVQGWAAIAARNGIASDQIERFRPVFADGIQLLRSQTQTS